jgi:hypothetical protein
MKTMARIDWLFDGPYEDCYEPVHTITSHTLRRWKRKVNAVLKHTSCDIQDCEMCEVLKDIQNVLKRLDTKPK